MGITMNKDQRVYALKRVGEILSEKLGVLKQKHTIAKLTLTAADRATLVRTGKVKLIKDTIGDYDRYYDLWDFSKFEQREPLDKNYGPLAGKLEADAQKVRDQIMLGDAEEALKLLAGFDS